MTRDGTLVACALCIAGCGDVDMPPPAALDATVLDGGHDAASDRSSPEVATVPVDVVDDAAAGCERPCDVTETCRDGRCVALPAWPRRLGGAGDDEARAVAVDARGNVYVAGTFHDVVDPGRGLLRAQGDASDAYVASFTAEGSARWARRFGGDGDDDATAVGIADDGAVYVAGAYEGTVDFGALHTAAGMHDVFVVSLDAASGATRWSRVYGAAGDDRAGGLAVAGARLALAVTSPDARSGDLLLAALDATGATRWTRRYGADASVTAEGAALTPEGELVVAGDFVGTAGLSAALLRSAGGRDVFVLRVGADGAPRWSRRLGGATDDHAAAVSVDGRGAVHVVGAFDGLADYGGPLLQSAGAHDAFAATLDADGTPRWARRFGGDDDDAAYAVASTADGALALAGSFTRFVDDGRALLRGAGQTDGFVTWLSVDGAAMGGARFGGVERDEVRAVAAAPDGSVYAAGSFRARADVGMLSLRAAGGADAFAANVAR